MTDVGRAVDLVRHQRAVSAAAGDLVLDPFEQLHDERLRDLPA
jgi:hypothetical protein